ncbi:MAG: hypothetical protein ACJA04_001067 [Cellvibrionaceae bacterium]|jgi:hypothetical protein
MKKSIACVSVDSISVPSVSVTYAGNGRSKKSNELGMRVIQERVYEKRGEQYLLIINRRLPPVKVVR